MLKMKLTMKKNDKKLTNFNDIEVAKVSNFLQNYMKVNGLNSLTADECADLLAKNNSLSNEVGPKPGFNFRQMLRDGRENYVILVAGAFQVRPNTRWLINRI